MSLRILLVEDEMLIAMMAEDMLGGLGHQVAGVHSGVASALEAVEAGGFDLALLDVNLGRESSEAVADALAARNIPFVFVTGYGEAGVPPAHRGGVVLSKPYDEEALKDAIERAGRIAA